LVPGKQYCAKPHKSSGCFGIRDMQQNSYKSTPPMV